MPLLSLKQVAKQYPIQGNTRLALHDIFLDINAGDKLAIVGTSGSGKSTLMSILGLLDKPTHGVYTLQEQNVNTLSDDNLASLRNRRFGFVFQQFHLLPRLNALQNVALPLTYRDLPAQTIKQLAFEALDRVTMMDYFLHRPNQLSGGQQQRVAIARALVGGPDIILADEPTGALDSKTGLDIMKLFSSLHDEGRTLILVTHDAKIADLCNKQIRLDQGRLVDEK